MKRSLYDVLLNGEVNMQSIIGTVVIAIFASTMVFSESDRHATIQTMIGSVKVRKGDAAVWKDAKPKMSISEKDAIRTFVESQAEILTSEGSVIRLDENTTMEMATFNQAPNGSQSTKVAVLSGTVLSNVKKLINTGSKFEFETPTATASIRGTKVGLEVTSDKTSIKVYEGEVMVTPRGASAGLSVKTNQMTTVIKGQQTASIEVLAEKQKKTVSNADSAGRTSGKQIDTTQSKSKSSRQDSLSNQPASEMAQKAPFTLTVTSPSDGQTFSLPMIPITGTTTPGADVTVNGSKCATSSSGSFSTKVPIPDEENTIILEIEASLNGVVRKVSRQINYKPNLTIIVNTPQNLQTVTSTSVSFAGLVTPAKAEVTVADIKTPVAGNGKFSGSVHIPDEEGPVDIAFEASYQGDAKKETRTVVYKRAIDVNKPLLQPTQLPKVSKVATIPFTVFDKTPDDEITFYTTVDGSMNSEVGSPNSSFKLEFQEGVHSYTVYAEDKSRNKTVVVSGSVGYLKTRPLIQMRKPAGSREVIAVPPGAPHSSFAPIYTVEFSILKLPDNDVRLIKEASIENQSMGLSWVQKDLTDVNLSFDVDLKRGENHLTIKIKDINDNEYVSPIIIDVK
jgi:hypothetical protein